jgi:hypothetical protein
MISLKKYFYSILAISLVWSACTKETTEPAEQTAESAIAGQTHFQLLDAAATGVDFVNQVEDQEDFNILTYRNFYNGGGVAIGDINNDSLPDLYFTSNMSGNKLYLNKGNLQFEDITEQAGVAGTRAWSTGVTMADVNGDGWLDIYVSNSGDIAGDNKENELFINRGNLTFSEEAKKYGLNNQGYSTQAAFFDYDLDGDLDCYLLNNSFKDPGKIELFTSMRDQPDEMGGDKLYRNDGGKFTDVSQQAGIYSSAIGFGLGAVIGDINQDIYPDIYISNDFWERDYLYINQGDGTFSEELIDRIDFCSISSMGGDMADINNDGHPEIFTTDMLAGDNYRLKAMSAFDPYHLENMKYRANYHYQIGQNCLHLNNGRGDFQEVSMLSGVAATDWSWGALIFDFENDGHKDLFVSNGLQRDLMYMDFRDFLSDNGVYRKIALKEAVDYPAMISQMPSNPVRNFAFRNNGNLGFTDDTDQLGLAQPSFSNGAAYGDLDNDGDLDLVINNVNMPAFIYQNEAEKTQHHYLKLRFKGYAENPFGIGAQVKITTAAGIQTLQNFNTRGFESSIEPQLIFGLGKVNTIESLQVTWPDKQQQLLTNLSADQTITLDHSEATAAAVVSVAAEESPVALMSEISGQIIQGDTRHQENRYNDFDHEILLWRMLSTEGPRIVKGDVNGDTREDFVLLGARDDEDKLFVQQADGTFMRQDSEGLAMAKSFESSCGAFMDVDQDGDQDLILGSGGNEYQDGGQRFILRYFENDGRGGLFPVSRNAPPLVGNFSCLEAEDFNGDGSPDVFLGGRCVPGNYGLPPRSFLMANRRGEWLDVTPEALAGIGMVTDATWADVDGDQDKDLIVVGEWMGVYIFINDKGILNSHIEVSDSQGWWNRVEAADLDQDGDIDFVLGNWGLNSKLQASPKRPLNLYVNDFDNNGKTEFILNWYAPLDSQSYPFATKGELTSQLPQLRKQILKYEDYAKQTYETLFSPELRQQSLAYQATYLESAVLWNEGGSFQLEALPVEAQIAPVFAIAVDDFNKDGHQDIWLGGNFYGLKPQVGRHDASRGTLLMGKGKRAFEALSPAEAGIYVEGEVRDAVTIETVKGRLMLISRNNEETLIYRKKDKSP